MPLTHGDTTKARVIAALICRVVDYYAARTSTVKMAPDDLVDKMERHEKAIAVAIENVIDQGALE